MLGRSWTSWGQGKHRRSRYQGKNNSFKIPMESNPHNYVDSELILSLTSLCLEKCALLICCCPSGKTWTKRTTAPPWPQRSLGMNVFRCLIRKWLIILIPFLLTPLLVFIIGYSGIEWRERKSWKFWSKGKSEPHMTVDHHCCVTAVATFFLDFFQMYICHTDYTLITTSIQRKVQ